MFKRFVPVLATVVTISNPAILAQSNSAERPVVPDRSYQLLREDEDWSFLNNTSLRRDLWDPVKYIPLRNSGEWYITIGGEAREVWEQIGNDNWGQQPYMNGYLNQRYMLSLDLHYGSHVRTFFELKSGLNSFRFGGPRPIDEKKLDFQAAFLELRTGGSRNWIKVRAGRQELEYGSGRLIDVREGPNVRLSFDGFKVMGKVNSWRIDGFAMRPDLDKPGFFDNSPDHQVAFWGIYASRPLSKKVSLDAYYLDWTASVQDFSGAPRRSCGILSAQDCRGRSRLNGPVGTSTTRRSGNSGHSARPISVRGLRRLKPAIGFQR